MKIAFDENIPLEMVRIFREESDTTLALGHLVVSARDYRLSHEHDDVSWPARFAAEGGQVVMSGDTRMRSLAHERAALADNGLIAYFFASEWNNAKFHTKAAMLLVWWPALAEHMSKAPPSSCWEIPFTWGANSGSLRDVSARSTELVQTKPRKKPRRKGKKARDAQKEKS